MISRPSSILVIFAILLKSGAGGVFALEVTTDDPHAPGTLRQGWWSNGNDFQIESNDAYVTGFFASNGNTYRGYFIFDLTSIDMPVTAAKLRFAQAWGTSPDPIETVGVFDVSTPTESLDARGVSNPQIVDDLGTGIIFGSAAVAIDAYATTPIVVELNAEAIASINLHLGDSFAVGLSLLALRPDPVQHEYLFNGLRVFPPTMSITLVPEPPAVILIALVPLADFLFGRRRMRRRRSFTNL